MKFIIDKRIFDQMPDLNIGVLVVWNLDNTKNLDLAKSYEKVKKTIQAKFRGIELAEYPLIHGWREIYKSFGEKKARSSVEALIRRILNDKDIPSINPLVDIYNLISLKHELPCGGEDLDKLSGDLELTFATGDEKFLPLCETETESPNPGEVIYKSGDVVVCRNFNYRESDLTKLTDKTKNVVLVFENLENDKEKLTEALKDLENIIISNLGGASEAYTLDRNNSEIEI